MLDAGNDRLPDHGLQRKTLLNTRSYIDGSWLDGEQSNVLDVRNPANGQVLGQLSQVSGKQVSGAIGAANDAFRSWRSLLASERGAFLRRWSDLIREHSDDLALIVTLEQGKPLAEARAEIEYAASFLTWYSAESERISGEVIQPHKSNRQMLVYREPVGVVAAITPWNFPSAMITRKAGAALSVGCTMVVLPSQETPFSAIALAELADEAGIPHGVFNVIIGDGPTIGNLLASSATVRSMSFTGSTPVGKSLLASCANTVKKVTMELGGHAPFIVFADCDLDKALDDAVAAKFQTSGQDCLAANRIYVERPVYEEFCSRFTERVSRLIVGHGDQPGVEIGPLIHPTAARKCLQHIDDAVELGARLLCGGSTHDLGDCFVQPTVLRDVTAEMLICNEETFGPVAALIPFDSESSVIEMANDTLYGLIAYVYTKDANRHWRISRELDFGMVALNTPSITGSPIPFGGYKQSGLGREGGTYGADEFLEHKYVCFGTD